MKNSTSATLLSCLFILVIFPSVGQDHKVWGQVMDALDGSPLIGAHIIPMSDWSRGTIADVDGKFELFTEQVDTLLISFIGYSEKLLPINGEQEELILLDLAASQFEAVEVVSERLIAEEFTVKKIRRLEVYKNPNAKGDALLAVNGLPSVTTTDESANISFRGSGPAETGIFLNQVPVYDAVRFSQLNGIGTFSIFSTEMVSSVNVFPGNPSLEYGNTTSGLIAINSRDEVEHNFSQVSLSMAGLGFFRGSRLGENNKTSLLAFGNFQPSSVLTAINRESLSNIPWFRSLDGGFQLSHKLGEQQQIKVFNYTLSEGYDLNFNSPTYTGLFQQRKLRNLTIVNYSQRMKKGVFAVNGGYHQSGTTLTYSQFDYLIGNRDLYLSASIHREKHRFEWKFGIAGDYRIQDFDAIVPSYGFALGEEHPSHRVNSQEERFILDGFGFFKYRPSDKISFGYAVRANAPIVTSDVNLGRQSTISFNPMNQHKLIFSNGTYHRYDWIKRGDLTWISSRQVSLDYQMQKRLWQMNLSVYSKDIVTPDFNDEIMGVETYVRLKPSNKFFWDLSYSFIDVERTAQGLVSPGSFDLNYFIRSGFEWDFLTYWTLGGRMLWRQGTYAAQIAGTEFREDLIVYEPSFQPISNETERLPLYQIIDLNLSRLFAISENMNGVLFASISNLTDRRNERGYTYNRDYTIREAQLLSRRTFFAGMVLYFQ
jgi:hypothetical protein